MMGSTKTLRTLNKSRGCSSHRTYLICTSHRCSTCSLLRSRTFAFFFAAMRRTLNRTKRIRKTQVVHMASALNQSSMSWRIVFASLRPLCVSSPVEASHCCFHNHHYLNCYTFFVLCMTTMCTVLSCEKKYEVVFVVTLLLLILLRCIITYVVLLLCRLIIWVWLLLLCGIPFFVFWLCHVCFCIETTKSSVRRNKKKRKRARCAADGYIEINQRGSNFTRKNNRVLIRMFSLSSRVALVGTSVPTSASKSLTNNRG